MLKHGAMRGFISGWIFRTLFLFGVVVAGAAIVTCAPAIVGNGPWTWAVIVGFCGFIGTVAGVLFAHGFVIRRPNRLAYRDLQYLLKQMRETRPNGAPKKPNSNGAP